MPAFLANTATTWDTGSTAWMLTSSALVFLMIPGLALFYGGMVRRKNMLNTIMQSFACMAVVGVQWVTIGYALAFGESRGGWIGWSWDYFLLRGIDFTAPLGDKGIPELAFVMFQGKFAIITPALIAGAVAERIRFSSFLLFTILWTTFVYCPLAHWVWASDGWLFKMGVLDFAGGTVVHISAGVSALVLALMIGVRRDYHPGHATVLPHHLPFTLLGAGLLWFGWFGFNAGSAVGAGIGSAVVGEAVGCSKTSPELAQKWSEYGAWRSWKWPPISSSNSKLISDSAAPPATVSS